LILIYFHEQYQNCKFNLESYKGGKIIIPPHAAELSEKMRYLRVKNPYANETFKRNAKIHNLSYEKRKKDTS
jgi:hypothetical protein